MCRRLLNTVHVALWCYGLGFLMLACSSPTTPPREIITSEQSTRFAVVGDSITEANSPDFSTGDFGDESWLFYVSDPQLEFSGGWARWGATTQEMTEHVPDLDVDILVILAGTNDLSLGIDFSVTEANLDSIAAHAGDAEVVISSIPPLDHLPEEVIAYNQKLQSLSREQGWIWVDATKALRSDHGQFRTGLSYDGVHPSAAGAEQLGHAIQRELCSVASSC